MTGEILLQTYAKIELQKCGGTDTHNADFLKNSSKHILLFKMFCFQSACQNGAEKKIYQSINNHAQPVRDENMSGEATSATTHQIPNEVTAWAGLWYRQHRQMLRVQSI